MSNPKHSLLEWIILAALIFAAALAGICILGRQVVNEALPAGSAAVGSAVERQTHEQSRDTRGNETVELELGNEAVESVEKRFSDAHYADESYGAEHYGEGSAQSFGGRQQGSSPQPIHASIVEDDSPIPPDGGDSIWKKFVPSSNK